MGSGKIREGRVEKRAYTVINTGHMLATKKKKCKVGKKNPSKNEYIQGGLFRE